MKGEIIKPVFLTVLIIRDDVQHYFIDYQNYFFDHAIIKGSDVHHITHVMRQTVGDFIVVLNNQGQAHKAKIIEMSKDMIKVLFVCEWPIHHPKANITVAQTLIKKDHFEEACIKMTECGVTSLIPILTERSVIKWEEKDIPKKLERLQILLKEASEQSERLLIPKLYPLLSLSNLPFHLFDLVFVAHARETTNHYAKVLSTLNLNQSILLLVGPEGGFSDKEIDYLTSKGAISLSFGHTILRSETAALAFLSVVRYLLEE